MKRLIDIQLKLKAPKGQFNKFGNYHYRNCEDILQAVKPLLHDAGLVLNISDDIINVGSRYYVKAIATLLDTDKVIVATSTGYAREAETKKGMDEAQITGSASSYARKYALNGLFAIDDGKDADSDDNRDHKPTPQKPQPAPVTREQMQKALDAWKGVGIEFDDISYNHYLNATGAEAQKLLDGLRKAYKDTSDKQK